MLIHLEIFGIDLISFPGRTSFRDRPFRSKTLQKRENSFEWTPLDKIPIRTSPTKIVSIFFFLRFGHGYHFSFFILKTTLNNTVMNLPDMFHFTSENSFTVHKCYFFDFQGTFQRCGIYPGPNISSDYSPINSIASSLSNIHVLRAHLSKEYNIFLKEL